MTSEQRANRKRVRIFFQAIKDAHNAFHAIEGKLLSGCSAANCGQGLHDAYDYASECWLTDEAESYLGFKDPLTAAEEDADKSGRLAFIKSLPKIKGWE